MYNVYNSSSKQNKLIVEGMMNTLLAICIILNEWTTLDRHLDILVLIEVVNLGSTVMIFSINKSLT